MSKREFSLRDLVVGAETKVPLHDGSHVTAINFDNAATTPPLHAVMEKIGEYAPWYSSIHRGKGYKSVQSSLLYEESRQIITNFVQADHDKDIVIYTKNTTESLNMLAEILSQADNNAVVIATEMEHLANDLPWRNKFHVEYAGTDEYGRLCLDDLKSKLVQFQGRVKLVTVTGASNVTGYMNPVHEIAALAHRYGAQICVDGAQLVAHTPFTMKAHHSPEHIDYVAFSAHKMYAPFGAGVLIGPRCTFEKAIPMLKGGGAVSLVSHKFADWEDVPFRHEAGTPNLMGVLAMVTAAKMLNKIGLGRIHEHENMLIQYAIDGLKEIPGVRLFCHHPAEHRVSLISFLLEGIEHHLLAEILSLEAGIAVRSGLFCAHPYVEKLLHMSDQDLAYYQVNEEAFVPGLVRISFGLYNTKAEVKLFLDTLQRVAASRHDYAEKYRYVLAQGTGRRV